ncbi:SusC/RagA family TonB-linked outer membrane protein [Flavihumibacter profundi]|jgi:TonB-dependent starch-binding outer membrane protein SusC|uniref:SusC/RagA family TonB-linked outer membrane protein n=1 Tax=Flavihumibacter profundi TaxID=2716883 RepID=UPI001CC4638D|nr:TonB-dependent receptor [Flavihumibacter profundi]MBZ5855520.1 TonB-dependent receptor [Flavihumibacter profundi]
MRKCSLRAALCLHLRLSACPILASALFQAAILLPSATNAQQQKQQLTGIIRNDKGEPVPGASIIEKKQLNGTTSGEDGRFSISVNNSNPTLVISHAGFVPVELKAGNNKSLEIVITPDGKSMNEVVVVGYGTQKKGSVTGAVATVKGADLTQSPSVNVANAIAGRVPGVIANNRSGRPGEDGSTILIRGLNSFGGGTSPLFVVDGIPDRDFSRINPADIENITVLKDASAAIYGVRSANGVILVTTKRGKTGKPTIEYDGSYGVQQLTRLPQIVNAWQYMTYYNEINPNTYAQSEIDKYKAGNDPNYTSTEWINEVFRKNAPQTSHSLSVRGGSDNVKYFFSGQFLAQGSNFNNSIENYKQFNIRSNIDARISKNLKVNLDIAARSELREYPTYGVNSILHETRSIYPFIPVHWPNGSLSAGVSNGRNPVILTTGDPGYNDIGSYILTPTAGFDWQLPFITKGLSVSGYGAFDINFRNQKIFTKPWDAYSYNKTTDTYANQYSSTAITSVTQDNRYTNAQTLFFKIGYDRQFGLHGVQAFVGYEQNSSNYTQTYAYRKNLLSSQVDQIFTGSSEGQIGTGSAAQDGRLSYLGRVAYNYDNKYLAEFTFRQNGSFNFPSGQRWGFFPAVSAGWRVSEEKFFKENIHFIDQLKLRASWGLMGNDAVAQYLFLTRYQIVNNMNYNTYFGSDYALATTLQLSSTPNPNITWETQDTRNIGIDLSLLKNKLNISADFFQYLRKDILAQRSASIPLYTGMALPPENIGKSQNRGVDFSALYTDRVGEFTYSIGANLTYAKSKVIFRDEAANVPEWQKSEGYPIDSWLVYTTNGIYHDQKEIEESVHLPGVKPGDLWIIDVDNNGTITSNDMVRKYESATPKMVYGLTLGGSYKGFGFNLLFSGQAMARQMILSQMQGSLIAPPEWMYDGRWTADHPEASLPRAFNSNSQYNSIYADYWLKSAAFLRLKTLEISYSFPRETFSKLGIGSFRIYASGFNLFSIDDMKQYGIDPETNNITGVNYPQSKIFRFGVNVSF